MSSSTIARKHTFERRSEGPIEFVVDEDVEGTVDELDGVDDRERDVEPVGPLLVQVEPRFQPHGGGQNEAREVAEKTNHAQRYHSLHHVHVTGRSGAALTGGPGMPFS